VCLSGSASPPSGRSRTRLSASSKNLFSSPLAISSVVAWRRSEKPARLTRPLRQRGERHGRPAVERVASEEWIDIEVPALIGEETFALAQQRLEQSQRLSPRNTRHPSLLQGILVCASCGYATTALRAPPVKGAPTTTTAAAAPTPRAAPTGRRAPTAPRGWTNSTSWSGERCFACWRTRR